jgi:type II secretory pathway pseudopilin PulG
MMSPHPIALSQRNVSNGLSLLEVMAAFAMVSIALAALGPTITLAATSRIHSRRIEAATNLAYSELDRVRNLVHQGPGYPFATLPAVGIPTAPPPAGTITIDPTGDFFVQALRDTGLPCDPAQPARPCIFTATVRVYSSQAFDTAGNYTGNGNIDPLNSFTSGPIAVLRARDQPLISVSVEISNLATYQQQLNCLNGGC